MFLHINPNNGLAIYDQIVRQIKFSIASESLLPGDLIPSVRELAKDLAVNPNTVSRAYRELQTDDVLVTIRGTGLQVTQKAPTLCRKERTSLLTSRIRSVLQEAFQSGLSRQEIQNILDSELSSLDKKKPNNSQQAEEA